MAKEEAIELEGTVTEVLPTRRSAFSFRTDMTFMRRLPENAPVQNPRACRRPRDSRSLAV